MDCDGERVALVGAGLAVTLQHPSIIPFERLWRRLPEQGVHGSIDPDRPFMIGLGAFRVPQDRALLIYDMRPDVYRFQGIDPSDVVPVESRRFQQITYDVAVNGSKRPGNKSFEIEPIPRQITDGAFINPLPTDPTELYPDQVFNAARVNQFGNAAGAGTDLLPQRPTRYGALNAPFSLLLDQNETFTVKAVIVRPLTSPIAFIEFDFAGFEIPLNFARKIFACMDPVQGGASA